MLLLARHPPNAGISPGWERTSPIASAFAISISSRNGQRVPAAIPRLIKPGERAAGRMGVARGPTGIKQGTVMFARYHLILSRACVLGESKLSACRRIDDRSAGRLHFTVCHLAIRTAPGGALPES